MRVGGLREVEVSEKARHVVVPGYAPRPRISQNPFNLNSSVHRQSVGPIYCGRVGLTVEVPKRVGGVQVVGFTGAPPTSLR